MCDILANISEWFYETSRLGPAAWVNMDPATLRTHASLLSSGHRQTKTMKISPRLGRDSGSPWLSPEKELPPPSNPEA